MKSLSKCSNTFCLWMLLCTILFSTGCVSLAANLIHTLQGNDRPAEYSGLKEKRVAIVCLTDRGMDSDSTSPIITAHLQNALLNNVKDCKIVHPKEVEQWIAANEWNKDDFVALGKGVEADQVVLIEVKNLRLRNGQTLYRGVSDISLSVFDTEEKGGIVYSKEMPEFAFPLGDGMPSTGTTEKKFKSYYLKVVADRVAGVFYPMDATADYALDATVSGL